MSTPVSIEPPPKAHLRTDSEQERDLQAKLQRMIHLQYQEQQLSEREGDVGGVVAQNTMGMGMPKRTIQSDHLPLMSLKDMVDDDDDDDDNAMITNKIITPKNGFPSSSPAQSGVGRGTLYFPSTYQSGALSGNAPPQGAPQQQQHQHQQQQFEMNNPPQQIYTGYGAVGPEQHDHEFRYGNPDYHDPYDDDRKNRQSSENNKSVCERMCCLYRPLVNYLNQEHLHRSFCYGAIDGMLTGSGIVSAFWALKVLTVQSKWEIRLAVVAFTTAACVADSLCMAMGHIWTSFVVSSGQAQERSRERQLLNGHKADAKAKLVDMLLARGMLKIDAMSLADTLEGYPDLFVSALVGDSLLAGSEDDDENSVGGGGNYLPSTSSVGNSFAAGFGSWKFPSYGQFNEMDHDPDAGNVNMVVKESQREGFFMMVGFVCFSIVPSLLWLFLPLWITPPAASASAHAATAAQAGGQAISLPSVIISIMAVIMWFLGVWKSRFLDSNWIMFGIETVVVLLLCVMSAYGVGLSLSYLLGEGLDGVILTNMQQ
jgi:hypothetical protein